MDPNANLREQMEIARQIIKDADSAHGEIDTADAVRLAELVKALNEWLSRGGAIPAAWQQGK